MPSRRWRRGVTRRQRRLARLSYSQPADLDLEVAVHDDLQPRCFGPRRGFGVNDAQLHPNGFGADPDRFIDDRADRI